jgi:hypothetical protein
MIAETRMTITLWRTENPCAQNPTYRRVKLSHATGPRIEAATRARAGGPLSLGGVSMVDGFVSVLALSIAGIESGRAWVFPPSVQFGGVLLEQRVKGTGLVRKQDGSNTRKATAPFAANDERQDNIH